MIKLLISGKMDSKIFTVKWSLMDFGLTPMNLRVNAKVNARGINQKSLMSSMTNTGSNHGTKGTLINH